MTDRTIPTGQQAAQGREREPQPAPTRAPWRAEARDAVLRSALRKRAAGVPTYSVPEAAALLSVSQEHVYRLVRAGAFPAVHMRLGGEPGRYVVPAAAIERLLAAATEAGGIVEAADLARAWPAEPTSPRVIPPRRS